MPPNPTAALWRPSPMADSMTRFCRWKFPSARGHRLSSARTNASVRPVMRPWRPCGRPSRKPAPRRPATPRLSATGPPPWSSWPGRKPKPSGVPSWPRIGAQASYGIEMKYVLVAPIWAIPKCLAKQGITAADVDLFEINEAFSGSTLAVLRELNLDPETGQRQRRRRIPGAPHRGQRLPGTGDPAVRNGPSGQQNRARLPLSGRRRSRGHGGGETMTKGAKDPRGQGFKRISKVLKPSTP